VLLTALSGRTLLTVHDPRAGDLTFRRRGPRVSRGGEERDEWLVAPRDGAGALQVGRTRYPGALRVRPGRAGGLAR